MSPLTQDDVVAFADAIANGGVVVFPADTVYGLAAAADDQAAVDRIYALKGRPATRPAAVMFFDPERLTATLPQLGPRTKQATDRLLPGPVTLVLPNPERLFLPASLGTPYLGVRVPNLKGAVEALRAMPHAVLQSSANRAGGPDAQRVDQIPQEITTRVDLVLDAGELPGEPSSVVDLREYEDTGSWTVVREGAVPSAVLAAALG